MLQNIKSDCGCFLWYFVIFWLFNHNFGAWQLENYAKSEEAKVEELIKAVADSGAKVIVSGGAVGDMALHFCERYKYVIFACIIFLFCSGLSLETYSFDFERHSSLWP